MLNIELEVEKNIIKNSNDVNMNIYINLDIIRYTLQININKDTLYYEDTIEHMERSKCYDGMKTYEQIRNYLIKKRTNSLDKEGQLQINIGPKIEIHKYKNKYDNRTTLYIKNDLSIIDINLNEDEDEKFDEILKELMIKLEEYILSERNRYNYEERIIKKKEETKNKTLKIIKELKNNEKKIIEIIKECIIKDNVKLLIILEREKLITKEILEKFDEKNNTLAMRALNNEKFEITYILLKSEINNRNNNDDNNVDEVNDNNDNDEDEDEDDEEDDEDEEDDGDEVDEDIKEFLDNIVDIVFNINFHDFCLKMYDKELETSDSYEIKYMKEKYKLLQNNFIQYYNGLDEKNTLKLIKVITENEEYEENKLKAENKKDLLDKISWIVFNINFHDFCLKMYDKEIKTLESHKITHMYEGKIITLESNEITYIKNKYRILQSDFIQYYNGLDEENIIKLIKVINE